MRLIQRWRLQAMRASACFMLTAVCGAASSADFDPFQASPSRIVAHVRGESGVLPPPGGAPWCGASYRSESYGFGLAFGYRGEGSRPTVNDEGCFRLGIREGVRIRDEFSGSDSCSSAFDDGFSQGFHGEMLVIHDPSECSNAGFRYGQSYLTSYARDARTDLVGGTCVSAYKAGYDDGKNHRAGTVPNDHQAQLCYTAGHTDADILP